MTLTPTQVADSIIKIATKINPVAVANLGKIRRSHKTTPDKVVLYVRVVLDDETLCNLVEKELSAEFIHHYRTSGSNVDQSGKRYVWVKVNNIAPHSLKSVMVNGDSLNVLV